MVSEMIKICKIYGIDIKFHYSYLILFSYLVLLTKDFWEGSAFRYFGIFKIEYIIATAFVVVFTANILIHELAHGIVNNKEGLITKKIIFFLLGAGACTDDYFKNPGQEFRSSSAGIFASMILTAFWFALYFIAEKYFDLILFESGISTFFYFSGYMNMWLVIINIIPAFPTDGGRMLRSLIWAASNDLIKSTKISAFLSYLISLSFICFIYINDINGKFWFTITVIFIIFASWVELKIVKTGKSENKIVKEFLQKLKFPS